ncbi:lipopolysaccharide biosynthesis protein [Patiriisocius marinus]|uniref:Lipopolysaccharide biosynthesis protein n=1 Tax=Patiriisocius marinus TaxID=1397112 RepID=A0A5J4J2W0_9FLAO|nr:lipopolysaccharide biosynthesis protein [Patiriisocius marinus]GER60190.1 lipopolysaccharide biosynthesis protein [Patiriisocius marinus]
MVNRLESRLLKGLFWSVAQVLIKRVFDLFIKLVLVNILLPEDFGIVGVAVAITSVVYVISDFGLQSALIQRRKTTTLDVHFQSVYWWSLCWSIIVFLLMVFVGAPYFSYFYEEPQLKLIITILCIPVIFNALSIIYKVKMLRCLDFKRIGVINSIAAVVSSFIALFIALKDGGLWSLVVYTVLPFVITYPFYVNWVSWKPKFIYKIEYLLQNFNFGGFTFISSLVLVLSLNIYHFFIGKIIDATAVGIYSLAFMLTILVSSQVTSMIDRVMFPFYSKIQTNVTTIKKYYLLSLTYYSLFLYPIMLTLIILSPSVIKFFFGVKWIDAKNPIRILAIVVLINLFTHGCHLVFRSMGKPKLEMKMLVFILIFVTVPSAYIGSHYGIVGVSIGVLIAAVINFLFSFYFIKSQLDVSLLDILIRLKPSIISFSVTFLVIFPLYLFTSINFIVLLVLLWVIYILIIERFYKAEIRFLKKKYLLND